MYLKKVELENFKSFGKKKKVPFLRGFTVITGPNGSGKSNIGDAILFVLGPKSPRAIRAGKLTNLIYNGGKAKKPAKYCRVSLAFDNIDRIIPLEEDEVTFTRLVKLSPSDPENYLSYFYVNGKKSSLTEFDDLLSHAHISADGYNLVKQGDVTRIVEMSNTERRRVLDDISGVTRYDEDIKKAEEKKKGVEENLDRIGIIIDEIKRQIKLLSKERGAALKYKDIKDNYDLAKAQGAYKKKEMIEGEIVAIGNQIKKYNSKEKDLDSKVQDLQKELEDLGESLNKMEEKIAAEGGEEAKELKSKIDNLRIEIARAKDGITSSKDSIKSLKEEAKIFQKDLIKLEEVLENLKEEKENTEIQLAKKQKELENKKEEHEKIQETVGKSDSEALSLQRNIQGVNKEIEAKEDEIRSVKIEHDRERERAERLSLELTELEEEKRTLEFEIKDVEFQLKDLTKNAKESGKSIQSLRETLEKKMKEEEKLYKESQELEAAITTLTREYNRLKAEAEAAESIKKGYNMAVSAILEARDRGKLKGIHGTIAELAEVEDKFEVALSVAAGARMQSIVVDSDECASKAIEYLKKKKIGRATFLPLNKMSEGRPRGKALMAKRNSKSLGFAIDLVNFKPEYKAAFWYVLGDTIVVDDLKTARELMGGIRLVTLEGELIEAAGAMIGGKLANQHLKFGAPSKSDIEKIGAELRSAMEHADSISKTLLQVKSDILELETQIRAHGGQDSVSEIKIEDLKSKRKEYKKKLAALEKSLNEKNDELLRIENHLEKLGEDLKSIEEQIETLKAKREGHRKALIKATPQEYAKQIKEQQKRLHELTSEVTTLESSAKTLETQIKMHEERHAEITNTLKGIEEERAGHSKKIKECKKKEKEFQEELSVLLKVEANMNQDMKKLGKKRDEIYRSKSDCESAIDKIQTKIETNKDFVIGLRTKQKSVEENLKEVECELEGYNIQIDLEKKLPSLDDLKETIASCERKMRTLEPINMKAIDDYDEQETRLTELLDEVKHLKDQRRNLIAVVKELDKKKKIEFTKVFEGINENFKRIFAELSVGGEAELLLENPESPFEGGLIIKARPRGKKILRLESLSGGEKSLTALALIFAIQHYEPSPFYLLDEVDMFLDAVNAEHVARMVKKNSRKAQFVMVSLRKVTLKEADAIYGVTMRADSISDVIGNVSLTDITEEIPALSEDETEDKIEGEEIQESIELTDDIQEGETHA
ncbi:MAG: chromosome segregation protein SMC [Thermoplasmata archaeon]|nr:MAG: chromosome segregation protein SMC [Thermoplasmata archaeon]